MMFERFTTPARNAVIAAQEEARALRHTYIGTEHLLLALLDPASGIAATVLRDAAVDRARILAHIEQVHQRPPRLLDDADAEALRAIGIDLDSVVAAVEESFGPNALRPVPAAPASLWRRLRRRLRRLRPGVRAIRRQEPKHPGGHLPFLVASKKALELSLRESLRLGHRHIGTEHLLLGLLRAREGAAARILVDAGLSLDDLRQRTLRALDAAA